MLSRRNFIKASATGMLAGTLGSTFGIANAGDPLRLTAAHGEVRFSADQVNPTRVMHYNQAIPGPVLRLPQGRESIIQFENNLDEASSIHWHGLRIDNSMDGVPGMTQAAVLPGEKFEYRLTPPDAGSYWYHTHQRSWAQLALGLAGVLIVEEEAPPTVDQDLVFAIDDWRVDAEMQIDTRSLGSMHDWSHGGRMGGLVTVNGQTETTYAVSTGQRVRLRLLNLANARIMNLLFDEAELSVVAIDGQPVKPFKPEGGRIRLAPGQRTDLMIDMTADPGQRSLVELVVGEYAYEVASFEYASSPARAQSLDSSIELPPNPLQHSRLPERYMHVPLVMEGGAMGRMRTAIYEGREMGIRELIENRKIWALNGIVGLPKDPLFRARRGTAVSIDVVNDNSWPHAMHIHGHHFEHDKQPGIWRDTALFSRGEQGSMRFVADNPGKWLLHCHMVEHMAGGMATWFEVT